MIKDLSISLSKVCDINQSELYSVGETGHFIISNPDTRYLLCNAQLMGYYIYKSLCILTKDFIEYISNTKQIGSFNIVNILRGGLNFPVEEACYANNIKSYEISFISSERVFTDRKVSKIESYYRKISVIPDAAIIIGDIVATGDTLKNVVNLIVKTYAQHNKKAERLIVLTIGTDIALKTVHLIEKEIKSRWPSFKGITLFYIEGIFSAYEDTGILKINLPFVDFRPCGLLSIPYREALISCPHAVFEKCVIYDGGARRFEPDIHIDEHLCYWEQLMLLGESIDAQTLFCEKMGYKSFPAFQEWKLLNHYEKMENKQVKECYENESRYYQSLNKFSLVEYANRHYKELSKEYKSIKVMNS